MSLALRTTSATNEFIRIFFVGTHEVRKEKEVDEEDGKYDYADETRWIATAPYLRK